MKIRNTFIIFIVSGFWHGANWTFVFWGALNALYFLPLLLLNKNRTYTNTVAEGKNLPSLKEFYQIAATFILTALAWVFFRAENLEHAFDYLSAIFSKSLFSLPQFSDMRLALSTSILIIIFVLIEWLGRENEYAIEKLGLNWYRPIRWVMYFTIILTLFWFTGQQQQFIYFQF
ncbi:hypothetical protein LCGC14_1314510 [marine sediment metagenome]